MRPPVAPSFRPVSRRFVLIAAGASAVVLAGRDGASARQASPEAGDVAAMLPADPVLPEGEPRAEGPLLVVTTTGILADLARQVGGQRLEVRSVLPANADPHDFEPTPQDVAAIGDADLLIEHGAGLDGWAASLIEAAPDVPLVTASTGIELRDGDGEHHEEGEHAAGEAHEEEAHAEAKATPSGAEHAAEDGHAVGEEHAEGEDHAEEDGHGHGEQDPHWWFDPTRTATAAATIADGLAATDPAGEATYRARAEAYVAFLDELDAGIAAAIETIPAERRRIVTNHDALGYYADRYGLEVVGTVIPGLATTAEPSAAELAALVDVIAETGAPAIFAENTTSPALAESLAAEAGIAVVDDLYTDSLGDPGSGADTYAGLMRTDTVIIVEALR
jgi:ABC-type Zn uptake system ZnuABC Zn-binding protein ZnuA